MNKLRRNILLGLFATSSTLFASAQGEKVQGIVIDPLTNQPIAGAIISGGGLTSSVHTDSLGHFQFDIPKSKAEINIWYPGFHRQMMLVNGQSHLRVVMIPESKPNFSATAQLPFMNAIANEHVVTNITSVAKQDITLGVSDVGQALVNIPGLQVISKSGMSSEGFFLRYRGNTSYTADNSPLIVVNGVPFLPDMNESPIIGGYSRGVLNAINPQDIQSITVLKGSEASVYGSIASNGAILIETDRALDLDTKVEFHGQYGVVANSKKLPTLGVQGYKSLVGDVALTQFSDMNDILVNFPFLIDDANYYYNYLYNNNTDWQSEIYQPSFTTDNLLKIKGGDAIAKYALSLGFSNQGGPIDGTKMDRYYSRLNADINLSKKMTMFTSFSMAFLKNSLQEQGVISETNPMLAAFRKSPLLSPYQKDGENNILPDYAVVRDPEGNLILNNMVSNPLAIVKTLNAESRVYDVNMSTGLRYKVNEQISIQGLAALYYMLERQNIFIPGVSENTIMPMEEGLASNTVRSGVLETFNQYYSLSANYTKRFNQLHNLRATAGGQITMTKTTYDGGTGRNTSSDFYKTLSYVQQIGRSFFGYEDVWNWMNYNASATYTYANVFSVGGVLSADASSSAGSHAARFAWLPSANGAIFLHNMQGVNEINWLNKAVLRADYTTTANSRYTSTISKHYYTNKVFRELSGIIRGGVPNTKLAREINQTFDLGFDLSTWNHRLDMSVDIYRSNASDVIVPQQVSSVFGTDFLYVNAGNIRNQGVEARMQFAILQNKVYDWTVGATISANRNKVISLPGNMDLIHENADGSALITRVGNSMYSFYGYQTNGVFATEEQASTASKNGYLTTASGQKFQAGDMIFVDQNGDGIINDEDRVALGSSLPKLFGNFYTTARYRGFMLTANFGYSKGNKAYNAVRRELESMKDYGNQLNSVNNRWVQEGQVTNMPRAVYGDPMNNSRFSDRWIEDASFLKLRELTLSYTFNFLGGTTVYATGENLFTATRYLGMDPEFMYSYDVMREGFDYAKVANPRSYRLGFKLNF